VYMVAKCVDSNSGVQTKIKLINVYFTLSPPSEISRNAVVKLALPRFGPFKSGTLRKVQNAPL
jgi:hypothetical protein